MNTKKAIGGSIAAIIILIAGQFLAQLIANGCGLIKIPDAVCNIIAGIIYLGSSYIMLRLFFSKVLKLPVSEMGMPKFGMKARWIIAAVLLPLAVKGTYLLMFKGEYVSSDMDTAKIAATLSAGIMFSGIAAAFVEEMVFRGIIMNLLKERWNVYIAVIIPSLLFGVLHILGMDYSIGSCLLVIAAGTMVGVMFSLIALESGSVWNSGIVHALWNIIIIGGGLYVSEKADKYSVMTYVLENKSFAVAGGEFGIEASVVSLIAYIAVAAIAFMLIKKNDKQVNSK